jgi:dolichol kinase
MVTGVEIKRKIVHLATLIVPVGYAMTSEETVILFLIPFFLALLSVDLLRHLHPGVASLFRKYFFGRVLREEEKPAFMGATYFILILIVSDTAAALVGKGIGRIRIFGKTLEGSTAFLITSLVIVWVYPRLDRFSGSLAALGATLIEMLPIKLNDNLSIPLVAGAIMFFVAG